MKKVWSKFVSYFIRGLVFLAPIIITILLISIVLNWVRNSFPDEMGPFSGLIIVSSTILLIAGIGFIGSRFVSKPIEEFMDKVLSKIPFVNTIYSSSKDVINSFFGDNKKFDKPVLVKMDDAGGVQKLGFITQQHLENLGLGDKVAIYFPISYSVAGDLYIVSPERVTVLDISSSDAMRFLISGGITDPDKNH